MAQSGLQTKDIKIGHGDSARDGDVLTMLYKGTLKDGKVFDESKKAPFTFKLGVGQVIKGWDLGMKGMKVGGKRHLVIPPALGYGKQDMGAIKPNSTLIFDVELLRLDHPDAKPKITFTEIKVGKGNPAKAGDTIKVHYRGTFLNGFPFDNSYDRNQPLEIQIGAKQVIAGFDQGVTGMKVGGKRKVVIPYQLAYGENGRPPVIPQMATLVFTLELISIAKK